MKGMRRRCGDERGASLIEAAILTPLLLLLTFGIVDFATLFYVNLSLESGVSQATRYAVTGNLMDDPDNAGQQMSRPDTIKAAMRKATPTLTIPDSAFAFSYLPAGGSNWVGGTGGPGDIQRVSVSYSWNLLTPLVRPFFPGGKVTLTVNSTMKNEGRFE
jgi:Flp pilus assembly protein TadG